MSEPTGIRGLLVELADRWGIDNPAETMRLFVAWERIVGPEIASRCDPEMLKSGILKVRAESAAWASELRYLAPQILRRVNDELGRVVVKQVKISVGLRANPPKKVERESRPDAPEAGTQSEDLDPFFDPDALVAPIGEEKLAEATKRALLAAKTRQRKG